MSCFQNVKKRLYDPDIKDPIKDLQQNTDITDYTLDTSLDFECIICLEDFQKNDLVTIIKCGHLYHTVCLYGWFKKKKRCPICNIRIKFKIK